MCDLGYFASERAAQVDRGVVEREFMDDGPELELVPLALTFVAVVPPFFQVDGKRSALAGARAVNGAWAMELASRSGRGLESKLL